MPKKRGQEGPCALFLFVASRGAKTLAITSMAEDASHRRTCEGKRGWRFLFPLAGPACSFLV